MDGFFFLLTRSYETIHPMLVWKVDMLNNDDDMYRNIDLHFGFPFFPFSPSSLSLSSWSLSVLHLVFHACMSWMTSCSLHRILFRMIISIELLGTISYITIRVLAWFLWLDIFLIANCHSSIKSYFIEITGGILSWH